MNRSNQSEGASSVVSEDESDRSFSDTEAFVHQTERRKESSPVSHRGIGWELDYIEDSKITFNEEEDDRVERSYKLKFKGYDESEWQPEDNVDALELVRCFWENVLDGPQSCIQAQQELLIEMENRSDSSDSNSNSNSNLNSNLNSNHDPKKKKKINKVTKNFKHKKSLKPRINQNDSDFAQSDSDSDSDVVSDSSNDNDKSFNYTIPKNLSYSNSLHQDQDQIDNSSDLNIVQECTYKPRTAKIRKLMKIELSNNSLDPASSVTSLLDGIDLNSTYKYRAKDPDIAKQITRLLEEIELDSSRLNEIKQRKQTLMKNKLGKKIRIIFKQDNEKNLNNSKLNSIKTKKVNNENENDNLINSIHSSPSSNPNKAERDKKQLSEIPINLYQVQSMTPDSTSTPDIPVQLNAGQAFSQLTPTHLNHEMDQQVQFNQDEDEEIQNSNPRLKRKFIDKCNMKFSTFNQSKKICFRKQSLTWTNPSN